MAKGDRIPVGITAGMGPILQPGSRFSNRTYGLDDGRRKFLVHWDCPASKWPQVGARDKENPAMYVVDVDDHDDPSGLIELEVSYKGIAGKKPGRVTPDGDTQMMTFPTKSASGAPGSTVVPVPQPTACHEYVATVQPTLLGVGGPTNASWLPEPPPFELTYTADPAQPVTRNYYGNQWVLQSRGWQPIVPGKVWFVREKAVYYYSLASA